MTPGKWTPPERLASSNTRIYVPGEREDVTEVDWPGPHSYDERLTLAAAIVTRWNAHAALVAACEAVASACERAADSPTRGPFKATPEGTRAVFAAQATALRAALAAAKGEPR